MGVVYKLEPKIKDFILEKKRPDPNLSCRQLVALILDKFKIEISKSSVNSIIKNAGLSMPVGRRQKKRRRRLEPVKFPLEIKVETPLVKFPEKPIEKPVEEVVESQVEKPTETPVEAPVEQPALAPIDKSVEKTIEVPAVETQPELPAEQSCTGAILLKAADYLVGGSYYITETIKNELNRYENNLLALTESLIYLPLFEKEIETKEFPELWALINKKFSLDNILSYLKELQSVSALLLDIFRIISTACQEIRCVKVTLSDGSIFYLDGRLYTIWSTPHIPYDFSVTLYNIKSYINKYFKKDIPFILSMAPGYDTPTNELFDFMLSLESVERRVSQLTLYGNKFEEIEVIPIEKNQRRFFMFGLWPWQFVGYRKVKTIGKFRRFYFEVQKEEYHIADIEIELSQPNTQQIVTLKGCALKKNLNEKVRLIILSNLTAEQASAEELVNIYLNHWPNLEESFQDFSRKIELFTYTASSQRFFSTESLGLSEETTQDITKLFDYYLKALDLYVKWHFLPSGWEEKDFPTIKQHFYNLKAQLKKEKDYVLVTFQVPSGYPFLKDLEYACRRINEREVIFADGKRLWLTTH